MLEAVDEGLGPLLGPQLARPEHGQVEQGVGRSLAAGNWDKFPLSVLTVQSSIHAIRPRSEQAIPIPHSGLADPSVLRDPELSVARHFSPSTNQHSGLPFGQCARNRQPPRSCCRTSTIFVMGPTAFSALWKSGDAASPPNRFCTP